MRYQETTRRCLSREGLLHLHRSRQGKNIRVLPRQSLRAQFQRFSFFHSFSYHGALAFDVSGIAKHQNNPTKIGQLFADYLCPGGVGVVSSSSAVLSRVGRSVSSRSSLATSATNPTELRSRKPTWTCPGLCSQGPLRPLTRPCNPAVAGMPILAGQRHDVRSQRILVGSAPRHLALGRPMLAEQPASKRFGHTEILPDMRKQYGRM